MSKAEQNRQTQSGPKHRKKNSDSRRRLKADSDIDEVTLDDKLFRMCKAATANSRLPMMEWNTGGTMSVDVDADVRHHRECMSTTL